MFHVAEAPDRVAEVRELVLTPVPPNAPPPMPPPAVTSCVPGTGTTAGGTPVSVGGTDFVNGATVTFGGAPATGVVFVSDTQIDCVTPAGVGTVDVVVTNPDLQTGTLVGGYVYDPYADYVVYDSLDDVDNTPLPAHTPEKAPVGAAWAWANGMAFKVLSNRAVAPGPNDQLVVIDSGESDVQHVIETVTLGSELAILIRGSGAALNGWLFLCSCARDTYELYMLNGAYNLVDSVPAVLTPGDVLADLELRASGTLIEGLVNGVLKVSTVSPIYQAQTYIGLFAYGDAGVANWDNLKAKAL